MLNGLLSMEEFLFYIVFPIMLILFLTVAIIFGIVSIIRKRKTYIAVTIVLVSLSVVFAALMLPAFKPHHLVFKDCRDNILGIRSFDLDEQGIRLVFDTDNECLGLSSYSGNNLNNDICNMFLEELYSGDVVVTANGKEVDGTEIAFDAETMTITIPKQYAFLSRSVSIRTQNYILICDAYVNKICFKFVVKYQLKDMPVEASHTFMTTYYCSEQEWKNKVATTSEGHIEPAIT